jgi:eukaryotic-like serine/threonine-protein kinase
MADEKWQQVREVFDSALRRRPDERRRFVNEACGEDKTLLAEVESLLSSHDSAESFMETPAVAEVARMIEIETKKLEAGKRLGHYEIIEQIGEGGMGEVYLAKDTRLERKTAIKILPGSVAQDGERMRRFVREAKSASALNHPNIITIYEIGQADNTQFIATEYIEGDTLRERLKGSPVSLKSALGMAIQVASALDAAHRTGIVHRDIKPENVMIRPDGLVKVLDFGIAKLTEKRNETDPEAATAIKAQTSAGMIIGTAAYMSPEQARGETVDARSDIFSFGVMLYEMLAGTPPFEGGNAIETIGSVLNKEPVPLSRQTPEVPHEIERIITKALRKDREERYQTAKDLLIDLKDVDQDLEFQNKLERSIVPNEDADKTQILKATTLDEIKQINTNQTLASNPKTKYLAAGLLALILAVGGFFGYKYLSPTNEQINSIAVLPFENKSSDADTDYLSDGLAESLIYRLSQLPNLKVSPTSSVFRYKGKETDAKKVADELGVNSVLTGRITQRGDSLTISVNLVDTRNGKSLWGEQYERKMSELLATQREIAAAITNNLKIKLSGESEQKLAKRYTDNNEAYQLYLKGRYHFAKRTKEDILKGIENFEQAIELDPNFALAYVEISDSYASMPAYPYLSPKEAAPQAKAAARKALEIDPSLAEAHTALGFSLVVFDWNWAEAEREFEKALELNPNNSVAHYKYGFHYLAPLARHDEAITELKRAVELEPLSLITNANLAGAYMFAGQNDRALEQARTTYELEPNFVSGQYWLALAYTANGMHAEAIALSEKVLQTDSTSQYTYMLRVAGYSYAKSGRRREAEEVIKRFKDIAKTRYVKSYWVASIYAALGDKDQAFVELENAFAERDWDLHRLKVDPLMNPLRDDHRFQDLMGRIGLPQ